MASIWSKNIQSTDMLYYSRCQRFNDTNFKEWFEILGIKENMKILDVGCAGGVFTQQIKKHMPSCEVYGIDLDETHIKYAKEKAVDLRLDVNYEVADIKKLPFEDNTFDLVFSHTVVEHIPFENFILEQHRVLKKGGTIKILYIDNMGKKDNPFTYNLEKIYGIYDKLEVEKKPQVGTYFRSPEHLLNNLSKYGFVEPNFEYKRFVYYAPDLRSMEVARQEVELDYVSRRVEAEFMLGKSKNRGDYELQLLTLLFSRYKRRLEFLSNHEKLYDYETTNLIIFTAKKA